MQKSNYWEFPPEKLHEESERIRKQGKILLIIGICTLPFLIGLFFLLLSLVQYSIAKMYIEIANKKEQGTYTPPPFLDKNVYYVSRGEFVFPETDENGHEMLTIYNMNIVGVMHEHDGVNPQNIIPKMYEGDQVLLDADVDNEFDTHAVKVKTLDGQQIGWLPKGENLQIDIFNRLTKGQTVYARVKEGYELSSYPGNIGLCIEVARYASR